VLKPFARKFVAALTALALMASLATGVLWLRSYRYRDRLSIRHKLEFVDQDKTVESIGGRIILSSDVTRHVAQDPSSERYSFQRQTQELAPGEAGLMIQSNDRLIAAEGWGRWGFGSLRTTFVQSARGNWDRLPSNDVLADDYEKLVIPDWAIVVLMLVLPIRWVSAYIGARQTSSRIGCCRKCGYDLRGTPDRCPECGTVPSNRHAPA
jgi:hypothetical protein